jgi:hypothetical protein
VLAEALDVIDMIKFLRQYLGTEYVRYVIGEKVCTTSSP